MQESYPAPAIVSNREIAQELMEQKTIKELLFEAESANIYQSVIGSFEREKTIK
ncbi:hypothetical protein KHA95_12300 [Bacillus sp. FJAT-50079]|nr:hypothetical protein [Bacillus sp. FJAT-50079]